MSSLAPKPRLVKTPRNIHLMINLHNETDLDGLTLCVTTLINRYQNGKYPIATQVHPDLMGEVEEIDEDGSFEYKTTKEIFTSIVAYLNNERVDRSIVSVLRVFLYAVADIAHLLDWVPEGFEAIYKFYRSPCPLPLAISEQLVFGLDFSISESLLLLVMLEVKYNIAEATYLYDLLPLLCQHIRPLKEFERFQMRAYYVVASNQTNITFIEQVCQMMDDWAPGEIMRTGGRPIFRKPLDKRLDEFSMSKFRELNTKNQKKFLKAWGFNQPPTLEFLNSLFKENKENKP